MVEHGLPNNAVNPAVNRVSFVAAPSGAAVPSPLGVKSSSPAVQRDPSVSGPLSPVAVAADMLPNAVSQRTESEQLGSELAALLAEATESPVALEAEKLDVYRVALELHAFAASKVPTLSRVLKDQIERASLSVVLNIAEAAGRRSRKDKARHYSYARGSATEVAASFDVLRIRKLAPVCECQRGRSLSIRVVQMLTKMCERLNEKVESEAVASEAEV